jgi:hypothetical protein
MYTIRELYIILRQDVSTIELWGRLCRIGIIIVEGLNHEQNINIYHLPMTL